MKKGKRIPTIVVHTLSFYFLVNIVNFLLAREGQL